MTLDQLIEQLMLFRQDNTEAGKAQVYFANEGQDNLVFVSVDVADTGDIVIDLEEEAS